MPRVAKIYNDLIAKADCVFGTRNCRWQPLNDAERRAAARS